MECIFNIFYLDRLECVEEVLSIADNKITKIEKEGRQHAAS